MLAQANNIRCINKALGASKGEIVVPELDLDQEVIMMIMALAAILPVVSVLTRLQGNHGSTALDPNNINGEQVDVTTVDSLNLQKYHHCMFSRMPPHACSLAATTNALRAAAATAITFHRLSSDAASSRSTLRAWRPRFCRARRRPSSSSSPPSITRLCMTKRPISCRPRRRLLPSL